MAQSHNVFLTVVAPVVGNLVGAGLLACPAKAMLDIRKNNSLGDLNPLPYPMTLINCLGWVGYGLVCSNPWIFPANIWGMLCGLVFTLTAYGAADQKLRDQLAVLMTAAFFYYSVLASFSVLTLSHDSSVRLWGISCNAVLGVYYVSPLVTMVKIIRTRNAASLYLPIAVMSTLNGATWTAYGIAIGDPNIWPINAFGAIVGVFQIVMKLVLPSHASISAKEGRGGGGAGSLPSYSQGVHFSDASICASDAGLLADHDARGATRSMLDINGGNGGSAVSMHGGCDDSDTKSLLGRPAPSHSGGGQVSMATF